MEELVLGDDIAKGFSSDAFMYVEELVLGDGIGKGILRDTYRYVEEMMQTRRWKLKEGKTFPDVKMLVRGVESFRLEFFSRVIILYFSVK